MRLFDCPDTMIKAFSPPGEAELLEDDGLLDVPLIHLEVDLKAGREFIRAVEAGEHRRTAAANSSSHLNVPHQPVDVALESAINPVRVSGGGLPKGQGSRDVLPEI